MLSIFNIASTGVNFYKNSLDAIAHNVANVNTVRTMEEGAVRRQSVVGSSNTSPAPNMVGTGGTVGAGVSFTMVESASGEGLVTYEPEHVLANEDDADSAYKKHTVDAVTFPISTVSGAAAGLAVI